MEYTVYHNPRCSKCRCAVQKLEEEHKEFELVEYLKTPLTEGELVNLLQKLGIKAIDLVRKNETIFKEEFKGKELSEQEWISAMLKYPNLIQRPIIVKGDRAVLGRTAESLETIIK